MPGKNFRVALQSPDDSVQIHCPADLTKARPQAIRISANRDDWQDLNLSLWQEFCQASTITSLTLQFPFCRHGLKDTKLVTAMPKNLQELNLADGLYSYSFANLGHLGQLKRLVLMDTSHHFPLSVMHCQGLAKAIMSMTALEHFELHRVRFESHKAWMMIQNALQAHKTLQTIKLFKLTTLNKPLDDFSQSENDLIESVIFQRAQLGKPVAHTVEDPVMAIAA
jgi:hypothetical protein